MHILYVSAKGEEMKVKAWACISRTSGTIDMTEDRIAVFFDKCFAKIWNSKMIYKRANKVVPCEIVIKTKGGKR
jgi:hypothetical protein